MIKSNNSSCVLNIQESNKHNWSSTAIVEPSIKETSYAELAKGIELLHIFWHSAGLVQGDKIAICAKNSAEWINKYVAAITGGYVAVLIPNNIDLDQIWRIIIHSKSKILYADTEVVDSISPMAITGSCFVLDIKEDGHSGHCLKQFDNIEIQSIFERKFPTGFKPEDVCYPSFPSDAICTIMYTSGTTGEPRGAMLSYGYIDTNVTKVTSRYTHNPGDSDVCVSPFSHIIGLGMDLLAPLCNGMKIIIPKSLNPACLSEAMFEFNPKRVFSAPIIICNLVKYIINEKFSSSSPEELSHILMGSLGGNIEAITTGGSAIPKDFETQLIDQLGFPLVSGYGSTEGGYLSMGKVGKYKKGSCGTIVKENSFRIYSPESTRSMHCIGEIQLKDNIFSGYYNNDVANQQSFTKDGWFRTGDLGYIDEDGSLFITGRCKDMLLTSNGENIYPEGIEEVMNLSPYIKESILVQRGEKLHAIVVPDKVNADADNLGGAALEKKIDEAVREASKKLPGFTIISGFELRDEPLERTPKGSLKRYLYSDGIKEN